MKKIIIILSFIICSITYSKSTLNLRIGPSFNKVEKIDEKYSESRSTDYILGLEFLQELGKGVRLGFGADYEYYSIESNDFFPVYFSLKYDIPYDNKNGNSYIITRYGSAYSCAESNFSQFGEDIYYSFGLGLKISNKSNIELSYIYIEQKENTSEYTKNSFIIHRAYEKDYFNLIFSYELF